MGRTMALAIVGLLGTLLFLNGLGNHALWDYHEPYVGGIIQEMARMGNWVVPTLNGKPYLEKPPLFYWMGLLSTGAAGSFTPWALRLPSALMALGTVIWIAWLGCRLASPRAGLWAGALAATQVLFLQMAHRAVVDMTFTATVSLGLGLALLALAEPERRLWVDLAWASLGLSFLGKGVVGPVMILWASAWAALLTRGTGGARRLVRPGWGMALGLALALGWVVPLALKGGPGPLSEVFLHNSLGRFFKLPGMVPATGTLEEHREPLLFYLARTPGNVLPWLALWMGALLPGRGRPAREKRVPWMFLATLVLLSASSGKRMVYLLPVLPLTFLQTGIWLDRVLREGPGRAARAALGLTTAFTLILSLGLPWFVVARVGMAWTHGLALTLVAALPAAVALVRSIRRNRAGALEACVATWATAALAFLVVSVPELDREWNPLLEPYHLARALETQGARVGQGRLGEGQLGFVNLTFGHGLFPVDSPAEVREALARPDPVVLLLEAKDLRNGYFGFPPADASEIPTLASLSPRLWDRAPALLLNPAAVALLEENQDPGPLALNPSGRFLARSTGPVRPFAGTQAPRLTGWDAWSVSCTWPAASGTGGAGASPPTVPATSPDRQGTQASTSFQSITVPMAHPPFPLGPVGRFQASFMPSDPRPELKS